MRYAATTFILSEDDATKTGYLIAEGIDDARLEEMIGNRGEFKRVDKVDSELLEGLAEQSGRTFVAIAVDQMVGTKMSEELAR